MICAILVHSAKSQNNSRNTFGIQNKYRVGTYQNEFFFFFC